MNFIQTEIPDVYIIEPKVFGDSRGYFFEAFKQKEFEDNIGKINFIQDNESKSKYGVLRGLHYQLPPYAQAKLVRVIKGKVLDVAVDIRKKSSTFGQHVSVELTEDNKKQMFIPQGFAHGYVTLSEEAIFIYKVDNYYAPQHEGFVNYADSDLKIDWRFPLSNIKVSDKDKNPPKLKDAYLFDYNMNLYK